MVWTELIGFGAEEKSCLTCAAEENNCLTPTTLLCFFSPSDAQVNPR